MQIWTKYFFPLPSFSYTQKRTCFLFLPNSTAAHIEILGGDSTNDGPDWGVLVNLHGVQRLAKNWWLIHVQHADLHCGCVFERARRVKPVVKVKVGGFYFKSICLLCFKI